MFLIWQLRPQRKCPCPSPELRTWRVRDTILSFPLLQIKRWERERTKVRPIAGLQWLSSFAKPWRGSAQITHSADKKLVISIDKKTLGLYQISVCLASLSVSSKAKLLSPLILLLEMEWLCNIIVCRNSLCSEFVTAIRKVFKIIYYFHISKWFGLVKLSWLL